MDIRSIHYFISAYEERGFTKAAERMHVVQSALSMQIRNLEDELRTPLFERNQRGLVPTAAGKRFYELCVPIARDLAGAKQEMLSLTEGTTVSGSLRIGIASSMVRNVLGQVLLEFHQLFPRVDIYVTEGYARNITEMVQSGQLDVGLGAKPLEPGSLSCQLGFTDDYALVSGRPINGPTFTPCDLAKLNDLVLVVPSERHLLGSTVQGYIADGRIKVKSLVRIDGTVAALESVRNSDWGAICLMNSIAERIGDDDTFIYPIASPAMQFDLYLLHDLRKPLNTAARSFFQMVQRQLREVQNGWLREVREGLRAT
jgi:DNA-binding transcriptional LysR family regulator